MEFSSNIVIFKAAGTFVKADNPLKVGATFVSYEVAGNTVTFIVDNAISKYYPDKGWGICMDLTPDMSTGNPAIGAFTLKGKNLSLINIQELASKMEKLLSPVAGG